MPVARMYKSAGAASDTAVEQTYEQQTINFDDQVDVVFELQTEPTRHRSQLLPIKQLLPNKTVAAQ